MNYLNSVISIFRQYRAIAEKAIAQVSDKAIFKQASEDDNSIAIVMKHMAGNMISRWTDFLTTDGEKPWRNRDTEFEINEQSREAVMNFWNQGWDVFLHTLDMLQESDLDKTVFIRAEAHTVMEAINRQLAHYSYHTGQIVLLSKMYRAADWQTLSIARNKSADFNSEKMKNQ